MSERTTWSNEEILLEVFTNILRDAYKIASSADIREMLKEALEDENPIRLRDRLVSLQSGTLLGLLRYLDGAVGPAIWPGLDLVNSETRESLSQDFQWSYAEAESIVIDEVEPPSTLKE